MTTDTDQLLYVEVTGTTVILSDGTRGTLRGLHRELGAIRGAFIRLDDPETGRQDGGPMVFADLGVTPVGERGQYRVVHSTRIIDRAEFDRIIGIDDFRRECGWLDAKAVA